MKTYLLGAVAGLAIACSSMSAHALTVTVDIIGVNWSNLTGDVSFAGTESFIDTDGLPGNEEIRWGNAATSAGKSGYRFQEGTPVNVMPDQIFDLGTLIHTNNPIVTGSSLKTAQLGIDTKITVTGTDSTILFTFNFTHSETDNNADFSCCSDLAFFTPLNAAGSFTVDGLDYTMEITGFLQNGNVVSQFTSPEKATSSAILQARITVIPEPATWALMILGFAALGWAALKRRSGLARL